MANRIDLNKLKSKTFGRLRILSEAEPYYYYHDRIRRVNVLCTSGRTKVITLKNIIAGTSQSCGCWQKERVAATNSKTKKKTKRKT